LIFFFPSQAFNLGSFIGSRLQDSETKLKSEYEGWIIINDPKLKAWEGKKNINKRGLRMVL
jgi:hypothetical protein